MSRLIESFKTATTLTAYRVVVNGTSAHTVEYPASAAKLPLGVTVDDVGASLDVPVQVNGKARLFFNDTVTCGNLVAFDTSGRGIPFTPAVTTTGLTIGTGVIGTLIDATIAATGTIAQILINPQLMR